MRRAFILIFSLAFVTFSCHGQLTVNEVCASNSTTIADETGHYEDWIELFNDSNSPLDLQGWSIGTSPNYMQSTVLFQDQPQLIPAQGFFLVWCDNQPEQGPTHMPFKLNNAGEQLFLFAPDQQLMSTIEVPMHLNDHSWGIDTDANWRNFTNPTPLAVNSSTSYLGTLTPPVSTLPSGIYNFDLNNEWYHPEDEVLITYSLNGVVPEDDDTPYTSSISLNESTVVLARAFKAGYIDSAPAAFHYLREEPSSIPVVSIVADFYDLFGFFGILNTWDSGEEIPASFTYIYGNLENYTAACGLEIHAPSLVEQQAFRLTAKSSYDEPLFSFPFYGPGGVSTHNALILRTGGDDAMEKGGAFIRDRIIHQAFDEIRPEHATSDALSANVYLNGQYWGLYQLRERQDSAYINSHFHKSHFDLLERSAEYVSTRNAIAGNWDDFDLLEETVISLDLSQDENLTFIADWMDLDNFTDYQLTEIFISNQDWLSNNVKMWRPTDESRPWQWLLWDTDWGLGMWGNTYPVGSPEWNALEFALSDWGGWLEDEVETELLQHLIANETFKHKFASRAADLRNSTFETYRWNQRIDSTLNELATELPFHFDRWELVFSEWEAEIDTLRQFVEQRPLFFMEHFKDVFELEAIHAISLSTFPAEIGGFEVNSITLDSSEWSGDYFETIPVRIKALPPLGYALTGWSDLASNETERFINLTTDTTLVALYSPIENPDDLIINEIMYAPNNASSDWIELYNPGLTPSTLIGYTLNTSAFSHTFEDSISVAPGAFLILTTDSLAFEASYPFFNGALAEIETLNLQGTATTLKLFTPFDSVEDSVRYTISSPWPFQANGSGASLELSIGVSDNSLGTNWFADTNEMGSPGEANSPILLGVAEDSTSSLHVAPNPFRNGFTVQVPIELREAPFSVYSTQGRHLFSGNLGTNGHQQVDCSMLASGSYFLSVRSEKGPITQLLLKQ